MDIVATNAQTFGDTLEQHFAAADGGAVVMDDVEDPHEMLRDDSIRS